MNGAGKRNAGSGRRLDRSVTSGPVYEFTVSKSGRDSLRNDDGTVHDRLSRAEMGTIVHLVRRLHHNHTLKVDRRTG